MKWIVGSVLLAVVAALASGRVPMLWAVYCFSGLFVSMGLALFFAFARNRHYGLLVLGITYVSSAILAIVIREWWPLVAGFALAWALRAMGMEPTPDELPGAQAPAQAPEGDRKS
jgi:hypothetical protein